VRNFYWNCCNPASEVWQPCQHGYLRCMLREGYRGVSASIGQHSSSISDPKSWPLSSDRSYRVSSLKNSSHGAVLYPWSVSSLFSVLWLGALVFLGCPWWALLRLAGGDWNAIAALAGLVVGVFIGVQFIRAVTTSAETTLPISSRGSLCPS
jgi:hypothetical protein